MLMPKANLIIVKKVFFAINYEVCFNLEHGDNVEKKKHDPAEHAEVKEHVPHGHNNQVYLIVLN